MALSERIPPGVKPLRRLPSKKNSVFLVERNGTLTVLKIYDSNRWENEAAVLRKARAQGVAVPDVIDAMDGMVFLEYIAGDTVNDILNREYSPGPVYAVCSWLAGFHKAFYDNGRVIVKSDAIFKNFILSDKVYGVDFELSHEGIPEEDIGEMIAFLLDTEPAFTEEKMELSCVLIERYEKESGIRLHDIEEHVASSLIDASNYRPKQAELLIKKAGDIKRRKPFGTR